MRENIVLALQAARGWTRSIPRKRQDELVEHWIRALDIRAADPEQPVRHAQRRQPAEGSPRPLADHRAEAAHPRRADPGHRRRREDRDPASRRLAVRRRRVGALHLGRDRGGAAAEPQGRGPARPADRRRARQRGRHGGHVAAHDRRRGSRMMRHRLIWPLLSIVALLLTNLLISPGFFSINMRGGHLYGSLIDIISFGAPLMLVALGMTLVIATGGIDLSVGAVAAISGACACLLISKAEDQNSLQTRPASPSPPRSGSRWCCGLWNGMLVAVIGIQPFVATLILMVAGRGHRPADHHGPDHHDRRARPTSGSAPGTCSPFPSRSSSSPRVFVVTALLTRRTALGMLIEAVGGNKEASRPGRRSLARPDHPRLRVLGALRRDRRADDQLDRVGRGREQRRVSGSSSTRSSPS